MREEAWKVYLDYAQYAQMGGELAEEQFQWLEMRARKYIDRLTHGRLKGETPVRESVKLAMWKVMEALQASDEHEGRQVQSLTNDGVSVKYADAEGDRIAQIVREYLGDERKGGVGLMYAGVDA